MFLIDCQLKKRDFKVAFLSSLFYLAQGTVIELKMYTFILCIVYMYTYKFQ